MAPLPRALIADDDAETRQLMGRILGLYGFGVTSFDDGNALADAVLLNPPDLIVTDQNMGACNGTEALGRIRAAGAMCPTVLVTAFPGPELTLLATSLGHCIVLPKPLDLRALRAALEQLGCLR